MAESFSSQYRDSCKLVLFDYMFYPACEKCEQPLIPRAACSAVSHHNCWGLQRLERALQLMQKEPSRLLSRSHSDLCLSFSR